MAGGLLDLTGRLLPKWPGRPGNGYLPAGVPGGFQTLLKVTIK